MMLVDWLESVLIDPIDRVIEKWLPNGNANALLRVLVFVPLLVLVFLPIQLLEMFFESARRSLLAESTAATSVDLDRDSCTTQVSE